MCDLIERLEELKADLRGLTSAQYRELGWAMRPIDALLDQCREEADAESWTEKRMRDLALLRPPAKCEAP